MSESPAGAKLKFEGRVLIKAKFFEVNRRRDEDNVIGRHIMKIIKNEVNNDIRQSEPSKALHGR